MRRESTVLTRHGDCSAIAHVAMVRTNMIAIAVLSILAAAPALAQERVALTSSTIGCAWKVQEKVRDYAVANDPEAVQRLWLAGMLAGECESFAKGEQVIVLERSVWNNMSRIKRIGAVRDFWIAGQAGR